MTLVGLGTPAFANPHHELNSTMLGPHGTGKHKVTSTKAGVGLEPWRSTESLPESDIKMERETTRQENIISTAGFCNYRTPFIHHRRSSASKYIVVVSNSIPFSLVALALEFDSPISLETIHTIRGVDNSKASTFPHLQDLENLPNCFALLRSFTLHLFKQNKLSYPKKYKVGVWYPAKYFRSQPSTSQTKQNKHHPTQQQLTKICT
jgi:hypothetical protein